MLDGKGLVTYLLQRTGSCWVSKDQLISYCANFGGRPEDIEMCVNKKELVKHGEYYTLPSIDNIESRIAEKVFELMYYSGNVQFPEDKIKRLVSEYEEKENGGRKLHWGQVNAVITMCNNSFCVITGGPGTGKTTVLTCAAYCMRHLRKGISLVFTAPTGKAARRVAESSGENACTVHKKFGIGMDDTKGADKFYEDVLIIDESSMNDVKLSYQIFSAIPRGKKLVWVGDTDQLPSVGIGAVLRDLIASNAVPVARLTKTFRQDNSSTLFTNIVNVREGRAEFVDGHDFHPIKVADDASTDTVRQAIIEQFKYGIDKYGVDQTVVLIPFRVLKRGMDRICSNDMNNVLQKVANGQKSQSFKHTYQEDGNVICFKTGDMVMQLKNRPECANGDVGRVIQVTQDGVVAEFSDGTVFYKPSDLDQLSLAYAMSVNKSQGSEYKFVVMVLLDNFDSMLNRNILYTGITRAKQECSVIYQQGAFEKSVKTQADEGRITLLRDKLAWLYARYRYECSRAA